jgi:hypothetical protein
MQTEICVVWNRPSDRDWLIKVREWVRAEEPTLSKGGTRPRVISVSPLGEALSWRNELPDDRLLVTVGFKREEIEDSKFPLARPGEPIILCEPDTANIKYLATASFVNNPAFVTCKDILPSWKSLSPVVRCANWSKSVPRLRLMNGRGILRCVTGFGRNATICGMKISARGPNGKSRRYSRLAYQSESFRPRFSRVPGKTRSAIWQMRIFAS